MPAQTGPAPASYGARTFTIHRKFKLRFANARRRARRATRAESVPVAPAHGDCVAVSQPPNTYVKRKPVIAPISANSEVKPSESLAVTASSTSRASAQPMLPSKSHTK